MEESSHDEAFDTPREAADGSVFSEQERTTIVALRERVREWMADGEKEGDSSKNSSADGTEAGDYLDDSTLWRYAKAREWDVEQALEMFKSSVIWKRDTKLNELIVEWRGEPNEQGYYGPHQARELLMEPGSERATLGERVFYGGVLNGVRAKHGRGPVMCERLGKVDLSGLSKDEELMELCVLSYCVYLEEAWRASRLCSATAEDAKAQAVIIVDLEGLGTGFTMLWYVSLIKRITAIGPPYFPEIALRVCIVRAPSAFQAIWGAVSAFLPQRTIDKVKVLGWGDYLEVLAEEVEGGLEALPDFLGGANQSPSVSPAQKIKVVRAEP